MELSAHYQPEGRVGILDPELMNKVLPSSSAGPEGLTSKQEIRASSALHACL
jgi:hypothetical protein